MLVIGLTGGIGTGKSEVSCLLEDLGAALVNADLVGHEVYRAGTDGWRELVKAFGGDVLGPDHEVDRARLGERVFGDPDALERLNAITHPRIFETIQQRLRMLEEKRTLVAVVEAALLIEADWTALVDEIWVVTAREATVIQRIGRRDNSSRDAVRARIYAQMPQSERVKRADAVIENNGNRPELVAIVDDLWKSRVSSRQEIEQRI